MYDFFISHASEDKDDFVRPLAQELTAAGFSVWYDETVLVLGDSLLRRISQGLGGSRFGVVVLSPAFFSRDWPQDELDGLLALEHVHGRKRILPVWHGVSARDVAERSPILAGRLAISSDRGVPAVVSALAEAAGVVVESPVAKEPHLLPIDKLSIPALGDFLAKRCGDLLSSAAERRRFGSVIAELTANAYDHGGANYATLSRFGHTIILADDGAPFDPGAGGRGGVGLALLQDYIRDTQGRPDVVYIGKESSLGSVNELSFVFPDGPEDDQSCEIELSRAAIWSYPRFMGFPGQFLSIPTDCADFVLDLQRREDDHLPLLLSGLVAVLQEVRRRIPANAILRVLTNEDWVAESLSGVLADQGIAFEVTA